MNAAELFNSKSLVDLLFKKSLNTSDGIFFVSRDNKHSKVSYPNILERANGLACHLVSMGIPVGSPVAIMLPTCPEFLFCFFGIQMAGCIPVAVYPPLKLSSINDWQDRVNASLGSISAKAVLTDSQGKLVIGHSLPFGSIDVTTIEPKKISSQNMEIHPIAFLQFSSGTTGTSKAVAITHRNAIENARSIISSFDSDLFEAEKKTCVSWLPLYHDMGLVGGLISSMISGAQLYLIRPENFIGNPAIWLKTISDVKADITVAPNFAYGLCTRRISDDTARELDLSSLKVALCGAEMIHPKTMTEFQEKFGKFGLNPKALTPVYGLAEATLAVTFTNQNELIKWNSFQVESLQSGCKAVRSKNGIELTSVGKPISNMKIEIRNADMHRVDDGIVGSIWISGPSVMDGYYANEKLTKAIKHGEWLLTGDYGFVFEGDLYVCGRSKEVVIVRGQNYDPTLIERSLSHITELREGCSVAFSSLIGSSDSEELYVLCETKKGLNLDSKNLSAVENEIKRSISKSLGIAAKGIYFYPPETLPRTSSGKIKRTIAKELWEKGLLKPSAGNSKWISLGKAILRNKLGTLLSKIKLVRKKTNSA